MFLFGPNLSRGEKIKAKGLNCTPRVVVEC